MTKKNPVNCRIGAKLKEKKIRWKCPTFQISIIDVTEIKIEVLRQFISCYCNNQQTDMLGYCHSSGFLLKCHI